MVTITAPGVEINELDLSKYDVETSSDDTQNVLVVGFASKGKMNAPYEFTNANVDSDLLETFGTPTNEAERYFFNTCSEIIKREKTKLYAVRFPYDPEHNTYKYATYLIEATDKHIKTSELTGEYADYKRIAEADATLTAKYIAEIANVSTHDQLAIGMTISELDKYRQGIKRPDSKNSFIIVDKTLTVYGKIPVDSTHATNDQRYMIGLLPIVTTAANALYVQKLINNDVSALPSYESATEIKTNENLVLSNYLVYQASSKGLEDGNKNADTISKIAAQYFPTINMNEDGSFENDRLKNIGVVVFKGFIDTEYNNNINYLPIESFVGSLKNTDVDDTTGTTRFIDDIINSNSQYIEFYSNCFNSNDLTATTKKIASDGKISTSTLKYGYDDLGILIMRNQIINALGFKELALSDKTISTNRILSSIDETFEKCKNVNSMQLDLVVDAGMSNIALFMTTVNASSNWLNTYNITAIDGNNSAVEKWTIDSVVSTSKWQLVLKKFDNFCKLRKDCMFIADSLRPLCLRGNSKLVSNDDYRTTVANTILPNMKYIANKINTSYGAGYCDWYKIIDPTTNIGMWMPPSSKAVLIYLDNVLKNDYWTAPAGVNYGRMNSSDSPNVYPVIDIAFNPTQLEAGDIYTKQWNYAMKFSDVGFVFEGQKTFQTRKTAFDRVNVRRLFLYLEKKVYNAAKYFVYQGNTAYTRQRLVDAITPYFEDAKVRGGLYDYRIQCDDKNNTSSTIDANELHVKIAIKPTKTIEFIECTFIALKTGASFTEVGMED